MAEETLPMEAKLFIQEIVKLEFELSNIVQEIRVCKGPLSELNNLNLKSKQKLNVLKFKVQSLEQIADEQDKETDRISILESMEYHKKEMFSIQGAIRKANLTTKMAIDKSEKEELLGLQANGMRHRNYDKENLAKTTSNITKDLMSIAKLMESQTKQSEQDLINLAESSKQVQDTHEEYKGLAGFIQTSRKLLNKYNRRELTDKLLIFFGLVLFLSTVLYILKKRLPILW